MTESYFFFVPNPSEFSRGQAHKREEGEEKKKKKQEEKKKQRPSYRSTQKRTVWQGYSSIFSVGVAGGGGGAGGGGQVRPDHAFVEMHEGQS